MAAGTDEPHMVYVFVGLTDVGERQHKLSTVHIVTSLPF